MEKEPVKTTKTESGTREVDINLVPLFTAILKKLWLIAIAVIIGIFAFRFGTQILIKPTYLSSFTAFVNNKTQTDRTSINNTDIQASKELVQTYSRVLTSNDVLVASAEFINLDLPYETLSSFVSTNVENKTQLIKVNVITTDANTSYKLAQAIANTAPTHMSQIIEGSSMKIVDSPQPPKGRYGPNYFTASLLGALTGAVLALAYILIKYFRDDTIKGEGDLEGRYNLPVIGVIPNMTETKSFNYAQNDYYKSYENVKKEDK